MDAQALGRYLRQSREAKELTLEDAERALHIRRRVLEAFELGDFAFTEFSPVQIRGFLRNYTVFLGLDDVRVLQQYQNALMGGTQKRRGASLIGGARSGRKTKRDSQPVPALGNQAQGRNRTITDTPPSLPAVQTSGLPEARAGTSPVMWILYLLVGSASLAVIAFVLVQFLQPSREAVTSDGAPGILGQLPPSQTFTPVPTLTPEIEVVQIAQPTEITFTGEGVQVIIELTQRAWLRVRVDEVEQFTGITRPGDRLEYVGIESVAVNASNAEALRVTYNGARQASYGMRGQQVDLTFRRQGVEIVTGPGFAPTPEQSSTPLPTPTDPAGALIETLLPATPPPDAADAPADADASVPDALVAALSPTDEGAALALSAAASPAVAAPTAAGAVSLASATLPSIESLSSILTAAPGLASAADSGASVSGQAANTPEPVTIEPLASQEPSSLSVSSSPTAATQTPSALPSSIPTDLPTAAPTLTRSYTATHTATAIPTATPSPTATHTVTATYTATATRTPAPTAILPPRVNAPNATLPPTKAAP